MQATLFSIFGMVSDQKIRQFAWSVTWQQDPRAVILALLVCRVMPRPVVENRTGYNGRHTQWLALLKWRDSPVGRYSILHRIEHLDPQKDHVEIYHVMSCYEFPWDQTRALELALYR